MTISLDGDYCWWGPFWVDQNYRVGGVGREPFVADRTNPKYNVPELVGAFRQKVMELRNTDRSNHVISLFGCDFSHVNASINYHEQEELISYWNKHFSDEIEIIYSTPSRYVKALESENNEVKWPIRKDDFFPFADDQDAYWSGFFTTRPILKKFEREVSGMMHSSLYLRSMIILGDLFDPGF